MNSNNCGTLIIMGNVLQTTSSLTTDIQSSLIAQSLQSSILTEQQDKVCRNTYQVAPCLQFPLSLDQAVDSLHLRTYKQAVVFLKMNR